VGAVGGITAEMRRAAKKAAVHTATAAVSCSFKVAKPAHFCTVKHFCNC
jgi:hypothetical protein